MKNWESIKFLIFRSFSIAASSHNKRKEKEKKEKKDKEKKRKEGKMMKELKDTAQLPIPDAYE